MAKWFLLAAIAGIGVGFWKITERYREGYSVPLSKQEEVAPDPERKVASKPPAVSEPTLEESAEEGAPELQVLSVSAMVDDALYIEEWGFVRVGDLMPDGSRMVGWWRSGSDYFAKVVKKGLEVMCRFERSAEKYARRAREQIVTTSTGPTTNNVATSILPSFLGGSSQVPQN